MSRSPGAGQLGAFVSGISALHLSMLLRRHGPTLLAELERSVEIGGLAPEHLAQTRQMMANIEMAARVWLDSNGRMSVTSAGGPKQATSSDIAPRLIEISTSEAADMLHQCVRQVVRLLQSGHLAGRKVGRVWLIDRHSVERYRSTR